MKKKKTHLIAANVPLYSVLIGCIFGSMGKPYILVVVVFLFF